MLLPHLFTMVMQVLLKETKQNKEVKGIHIWTEEVKLSSLTDYISLFIEIMVRIIFLQKLKKKGRRWGIQSSIGQRREGSMAVFLELHLCNKWSVFYILIQNFKKERKTQTVSIKNIIELLSKFIKIHNIQSMHINQWQQ